MSPDRLALRGARIAWPGATEPSDGLDVELRPGRATVLLGRSGAGKTLLSRLLLGSLPPAPLGVRGSIELGAGEEAVRLDLSGRRPGVDLGPVAALRGRVVGYVPQGGRESLVPGWPVGRFLAALGPAAPDPDALERHLRHFGLPSGAGLRDRVATELSEGMIRRLLLAICLSGRAPLLVVDEPTTGLDPALRSTAADALAGLVQQGRGLVVATHDVALARRVGTDFLLVERGVVVSAARAGQDWPGDFDPWRDDEVAP